MALRQTTGFVASLLKLANLDWPVPDFSTLCRRQKDLAVSISCRKSSEPLHLLIDSTGIKALHAAKKAMASGMPASTARQSAANGASCTSRSTRKRWKYGPSRSPAQVLVMPPCSLNCCRKFRPMRTLPR